MKRGQAALVGVGLIVGMVVGLVIGEREPLAVVDRLIGGTSGEARWKAKARAREIVKTMGPMYDAVYEPYARQPAGAALLAASDDEYAVWLQLRLLRAAMNGELFSATGTRGVVRMRFPAQWHEQSAWYICQVWSGDGTRLMGPRVVWPDHTPDVMVDPVPGYDHSGRNHAVVGAVDGDTVYLDMYRLPFGGVTNAEEIDATVAVEQGQAELMLRVALPVVIQK